MTEFTDIDLAADVADMSEEEAKKTLSEFKEAHQKNRTAYDELKTEFRSREEELEDELDEKEEKISEFKEERAEEAAEYVNIPADLVASRFSFSEIEQIIEEGAEFSDEAGDDDDEGDEDRTLTTFSDQLEKGKTNSGESGPSEDARELIHSKW